MKIGVACIFFTVLVGSCSAEKKQVPDEVLAPARMQAVLWEMIRADVFVRDHLAPDSLQQPKSFGIYNDIFRRHGTTREQFRESLTYYRRHPDLFKPLLDSLEQRQKRVILRVPADTARRTLPQNAE